GLEFDHEQPAMRFAAQQSLGHQPLHGLAQRTTRDLETSREIGLPELGARGQRAGHDRVSELAGDDRRRRFPVDRFDVGQHAYVPFLRNRVPSPGTGGGTPTSRKPSHTVTWLAVRTGLPRRCSRGSINASVRMAVSGTSNASVSGRSRLTLSSTTSSGRSRPTAAAVAMSAVDMATTSTPPWARKSANSVATSRG